MTKLMHFAETWNFFYWTWWYWWYVILSLLLPSKRNYLIMKIMN